MIPEADKIMQKAWEARKRGQFSKAGQFEQQAREILQQAGIDPHDIAIQIMEFKEQAGRKEMGLREAVIRLAHENPEGIRKHLVPLLRKSSLDKDEKKSLAMAKRNLMQIGEHFKRKHGLAFEWEPLGGTLQNSPAITIWDLNDEPLYAARIGVEYDPYTGDWRVDVHSGRSGHGVSFDDSISFRNLIREIEKLAKKNRIIR